MLRATVSILYLAFSLVTFPIEIRNTTDRIVSQRLRTVQFYSSAGETNSEINYPVTRLYSEAKLILEFDELGNEVSSYSATIINCTWDWKISSRSDIDYLEEYNEFAISEIERSTGTKIDFSHYRFEVPKILLTGNYILVVFDDQSPDKPVLIKRFSIYSGKVAIKQNDLSDFIAATSEKQMLNFDIQTSSSVLNNPLAELHVIIRQNGRWDKYVGDIKPSFMDLNTNTLSYQFVNESEVFDGGNEFRVFDSRSSNVTGINLYSQDYTTDTSWVKILEQEDRSILAYFSQEDINGQFVIDNYEFGNGDTEADYVKTKFSFRTYPRPGKVYLFGALTNWNLNPQFEFKYNHTKKRYEASPLVKQGYYNYSIVYLEDNQLNEKEFEGSFHQTENTYEVFVYYKKPDQFSDELTGYKLFRINKY